MLASSGRTGIRLRRSAPRSECAAVRGPCSKWTRVAIICAKDWGRADRNEAALKLLAEAGAGRTHHEAVDVSDEAAVASPASFAHGADLLAKDIALLGDVLGPEDIAFDGLNAASRTFLSRATGQRE
jgi:hypothetical protein